jgi:hypothetical protein
MRASYELWAVGQLKEKKRCRVEGTMSCIPLRTDPICRGCFESDMEEIRQARPAAIGKSASEDGESNDNA